MRAELEKRLTTTAERDALARELIRDELVELASKVYMEAKKKQGVLGGHFVFNVSIRACSGGHCARSHHMLFVRTLAAPRALHCVSFGASFLLFLFPSLPARMCTATITTTTTTAATTTGASRPHLGLGAHLLQGEVAPLQEKLELLAEEAEREGERRPRGCAESRDHRGCTLLMIAVEGDHVELVSMAMCSSSIMFEKKNDFHCMLGF
jgi:hypothetical protein